MTTNNLLVHAKEPAPCLGSPPEFAPEWQERRSLAEVLYELEREVSSATATPSEFVPDGTQLDYVDLYCKLYWSHFGYRLARSKVNTPHWKEFLEKAYNRCEDAGLDFAVWIAAQMDGMKASLTAARKQGKRAYFMPNMLVGDKATLRYNVYVEKLQQKYGRTREDVNDADSPLGRVIAELAVEAEHIGTYFVHAAVEEAAVSWGEAIDAIWPDDVWLAAQALAAGQSPEPKHKHALARLRADIMLTDEEIVKAFEIATLRAAVVVGSKYEYGLADRIGFKPPFSWLHFAKLMHRLFAGRADEIAEPDLKDVDGFFWRPNEH